MEIKIYDSPPKEAKEIRENVFVKEQGFHDAFDEIDFCSKHLVLFDNTIPIATCRFFQDKSNKSFVVGRFAVMKQYRGQGMGSYLLDAAEAEIKAMGGKEITLHAQIRAMKFYENQGYHCFGSISLEQDYPHIWMHKKIGVYTDKI